MDMREIERKFLVAGDFKSVAYAVKYIRQGYICSAKNTVRVRILGDKGFITIKGPSTGDGLSRFEWEKEIPLAEVKELFHLCSGEIEKNRYYIRSGKHTVEVDEFMGENKGLIVAEIELESESEDYIKPSFLSVEVTGQNKYYNSELTKRPFKDW